MEGKIMTEFAEKLAAALKKAGRADIVENTGLFNSLKKTEARLSPRAIADSLRDKEVNEVVLRFYLILLDVWEKQHEFGSMTKHLMEKGFSPSQKKSAFHAIKKFDKLEFSKNGRNSYYAWTWATPPDFAAARELAAIYRDIHNMRLTEKDKELIKRQKALGLESQEIMDMFPDELRDKVTVYYHNIKREKTEKKKITEAKFAVPAKKEVKLPEEKQPEPPAVTLPELLSEAESKILAKEIKHLRKIIKMQSKIIASLKIISNIKKEKP